MAALESEFGEGHVYQLDLNAKYAMVAEQRRTMLERRVVRFAVASRLAVLTLCATFDAAVCPSRHTRAAG